MSSLITKQEAADSGLTFYYTGERCRYGHEAARYVKSGNCVECARGNVPSNTAYKNRGLAVENNVRQRAGDLLLAQELAKIDREFGFGG